jgi:hypothetical protein
MDRRHHPKALTQKRMAWLMDRHACHCDQIIKSKAVWTFRKGFGYPGGGTEYTWANDVGSALKKIGLTIRFIGTSQGVNNVSHVKYWEAIYEIEEESTSRVRYGPRCEENMMTNLLLQETYQDHDEN